ncbi:hypothetical protein [Arcobacter sp. CECT 8985]|uniref:hypothetical protein n=1 Tax=Arcobacter sp. CECT 8985 TaxID=1935424 RepID=UPI002159E330|nr:hypothetical protein [Arcobacter sp. CECT 8985]
MFFLIVESLFSQENKQIVDLTHLYKKALEQNFTIIVKNNNIIINNKQKFSINKDKSECIIGLYCQGNYNSMLVLEQLVKRHYKESKTKKNKLLLDMFYENKAKKLDAVLLFQLSLIYFDTLKLQKNKDLLQERIYLIKDNMKISKKREKSGIKQDKDLKKWNVELKNVKNDLLKVKEKILKNKTSLSYLTNSNIKNKKLKDYFIDSEEFKILNETIAFYINNKEKFDSISSKLSNEIIQNDKEIKILNSLIEHKSKVVKKSNKYEKQLKEKSQKNIQEGKNLTKEHKPWSSEKFDKIIQEKLSVYMNAKITNKTVQNKSELQNLIYTLSNKKIKIKKKIYDILKKVLSSYKTINNTYISSITTRNNFIGIKKLYDRSKIDMKVLLDSQNSMIISNQNRYSSIYDYLENILMLYYDAGSLNIIYDKNEKSKFETKIFR